MQFYENIFILHLTSEISEVIFATNKIKQMKNFVLNITGAKNIMGMMCMCMMMTSNTKGAEN